MLNTSSIKPFPEISYPVFLVPIYYCTGINIKVTQYYCFPLLYCESVHLYCNQNIFVMLKYVEVSEKSLINMSILPKMFIRILTYIQLTNPSMPVIVEGLCFTSQYYQWISKSISGYISTGSIQLQLICNTNLYDMQTSIVHHYYQFIK